MPLDKTEKELMRKSAEEIRSNIRTVEEGGRWKRGDDISDAR
jgi:hypothetical protein